MARNFYVEEWTDEQIAEHKGEFPESDARRFAVVDDDGDVVGFFDGREDANALIVTMEREAMIEESFLEWVRTSKERFVSDYDEIRKIVRACDLDEGPDNRH
jgi:hypothetical protein